MDYDTIKLIKKTSKKKEEEKKNIILEYLRNKSKYKNTEQTINILNLIDETVTRDLVKAEIPHNNYCAYSDKIKNFEDLFDEDECLKMKSTLYYEDKEEIYRNDYVFLLPDNAILNNSTSDTEGIEDPVLREEQLNKDKDLLLMADIIHFKGTPKIQYMFCENYNIPSTSIKNDEANEVLDSLPLNLDNNEMPLKDFMKEITIEEIVNRIAHGKIIKNKNYEEGKHLKKELKKK